MELSVLHWFCEYGGLDSLWNQCQIYINGDPTVFTFHLLIDTMQLLEHDALLGELVLHQPNMAWPLFQHVCYQSLTNLKWLPSLKSPSQLLLLIRLDSLPNLPGYIVEHICDLQPPIEEPRFFQITGTISSMTVPERYTESAVFSCPNDCCSLGEVSRYISVHVAGASEAATINGDWSCYSCGVPLIEDVSCRTLADKIYLILIPSDNSVSIYTPAAESCRLQGLYVVVRRELCKGLLLGSKITIIGVLTHRLTTHNQKAFIESIIEVNNVLKDTSPRQPVLLDFPASIVSVLKDSEFSFWAFSSILAYKFAADVCPPGCYHRLKMALLLSLVNAGGVQEEGKSNDVLNLLLYGSDSSMIHQLLTIGRSLALTSIHHTSIKDLVATHRKNNIGTFIDAGSLLLAHGGVCTIEHLGTQKKETREGLQKALETDQIMMKIPKQLGMNDTQEFSWSLDCTIWAHLDQQDRKSDKEVLREHSLHDFSVVHKRFADHFGLVVVNDPTDIDTQDYLHDRLMSHTINISHKELVSYADLHHYLKNVSLINVELNENTSDFLKAFYVASRRVRTSIPHGTEIPTKALKSLYAIACAHARLNMRRKAMIEDAVMAIYLYEESLTSRFGYSVLGLIPCPHFKPNADTSTYIGEKFDAYLKDLHQKILDFCKCHGVIDNNYVHEE